MTKIKKAMKELNNKRKKISLTDWLASQLADQLTGRLAN